MNDIGGSRQRHSLAYGEDEDTVPKSYRQTRENDLLEGHLPGIDRLPNRSWHTKDEEHCYV